MGFNVLYDIENPAITPYPGGQTKFAEDWEHFIVGAEGGWYSGKSFLGSGKLISLHLFNAFDKNDDPTYCPSLVVAPTYSNIFDFCVPHLQERCKEAGISFEQHSNLPLPGGKYHGPAIILSDLGTKTNPSVILLRSADVPKRITGFTVGAAWGDEPARWKMDRFVPTNDAFIQLLGRVRHRRARFLQIILTYTNEGDATRVYEEMHRNIMDRALYRIPTCENISAKDFYRRQLTHLTSDLAEQYLEGKAVSMRAGKVYSEFDPLLHVDGNVHIRSGLPIQISIDFNRVPGVYMEVGQYHPDLDQFTVLYEIHKKGLTVEDAASKLVSLIEELDLRSHITQTGGLEVYGDATGQAEWEGDGRSRYEVLIVSLQQHKIPFFFHVPKSNPHILDRVRSFNIALKDLSGEIHYKIHPRCEGLINDLKNLYFNQYGEIDKSDRKLSHPSDAEGYRCWWIRPIRALIEDTEVGGRFSVG